MELLRIIINVLISQRVGEFAKELKYKIWLKCFYISLLNIGFTLEVDILVDYILER